MPELIGSTLGYIVGAVALSLFCFAPLVFVYLCWSVLRQLTRVANAFESLTDVATQEHVQSQYLARRAQHSREDSIVPRALGN